MSNSLDPDQAQHFVGPGLGPNCLQRFSANNTRREKISVGPQLYSRGEGVVLIFDGSFHSMFLICVLERKPYCALPGRLCNK